MSKENLGKNRQVEDKMTEIDSQIKNEKNRDNYRNRFRSSSKLETLGEN